jgi:hypothetical protein
MTKKEVKIKDSSFKSLPEQRPSRLSFHPAYLVLYGLAIISALWQHGHPFLTLVLLFALVPFGALAYTPYRIVSRDTRFLLQLVIILLAGAWFFYRAIHKVQLDKSLLESVCIVGFCMVFAQRREDYDYMMLISLFLLIYGALLPRTVFIVILFFALILAMVILYSTRMRSLSGTPGVLPPRGVIRRNWPHILLHIILVCFISWFVFSILPTEKKRGGGLFEVSFNTDNDPEMPGFILWFKPEKVKKSDRGKMELQNGSPTSIGQKGTPITVKKMDSMSSSGNGGSSPPGKDMIFKVKSPIKLYWLVQLYDRYDGNEWLVSDELKKKGEIQKAELKSKLISYSVEQNFVMEKWVSNKLYAAYRPFVFENTSAENTVINIETNFYQGWLKEKTYPPLPFRYRVYSALYLPNVKKDNGNGESPSYWLETLPQNHYLQLPEEKISNRVRQLTRLLTQNAPRTFEKAIILRNYLRENFKYQQFSHKVPDGREAVDYFVFELREGHCEYYASALTVMARLAGMPARVAVGFSPGNYNALNGYFEVHEYHAHAWTQIYIEKMGWITFDATPPGEIISNTTPFAIGSLRDPFGDSWRIMPPELTRQALSTIKKGLFDNLNPHDGEDLTVAEKALLETAMAPEKIQENIRNMLNAVLPKIKGDGIEKLKTIYDDLKRSLAKMLDNAGNKISMLWSLARNKWKLVFPLLIMIVAIHMEVKILRRYFYRRRLLKKCRDWYRRAVEVAFVSPNETVRLCYLTIRELLVLAKYPRYKNAELFEYGVSLNSCDLQLAKDVIVVFFLYSKYEYGTEKVSAEDCSVILARTAAIREFIYTFIQEREELDVPAHHESKKL